MGEIPLGDRFSLKVYVPESLNFETTVQVKSIKNLSSNFLEKVSVQVKFQPDTKTEMLRMMTRKASGLKLHFSALF